MFAMIFLAYASNNATDVSLYYFNDHEIQWTVYNNGVAITCFQSLTYGEWDLASSIADLLSLYNELNEGDYVATPAYKIIR